MLFGALGLTAFGDVSPAPAPSITQPPLNTSLKTEIRRGYAVANVCHKSAGGQGTDSFDACLRKAIAHELHNPNVYHYMLGMEFGCWRLADIAEGKYALVYYFELRSYQKHLGLSDDQILAATRTHDLHTRDRLAYWAKYRPATPVALGPIPPNNRQALR